MINILYIIPSALRNGGIEKMVISWISQLDREFFHVDCIFQFLEDQENLEKLRALGCEVYEMPLRYRQLRERRLFFKRVIEEKNYSIIHLHTCCAIDFQALLVAKELGVPVRIAHSHGVSLGNSQILLNILHMLSRRKMVRYATDCLACSTEAGVNLFGKAGVYNSKFLLIHNGIETKKFMYDQARRERIRSELNISHNQILLGCIARYDPMKRLDFAVEVLRECCASDPSKYHLLLIGDGGGKPTVEKIVKQYGLDDHVTFISNTTDVPSYLSAMDAMVFPSIREGLSVVLVEAQCNGLPCFTTDQISRETQLTDHFVMLPVCYAAGEWKKAIDEYFQDHKGSRLDGFQTVRSKGYDIEQSAKDLFKIYSKAFQGDTRTQQV